MIRTIFTASVASAAIAFAGPAMAGPGHGGPPSGGAGAGANAHMNTNVMGGPNQAGIDARVNSQGSINASGQGAAHANENSAVHANTSPTVKSNATNSQGLQNASPTGIAHASPNSVLARGAVPSTSLPNLTTGLNVQTTGGTVIGQVSQVVTDSSGNVRLVVVTDTSTGQTFRLAPNTLSISGGVVTTTSTSVGG